MPEITSEQLASGLNQLWNASSTGNQQQFQEALREFNLNYANSVAQLYSQNWGPGQPAPIGATTLSGSQAFGGMGFIPGYTGLSAGQTMGQLAQGQSMAQSAAGLTGWYAAPSQSQWSPGTFVRHDPSTYDTQQYGDVQLDYVLPSGQLQRVSLPQARAMGWNGDLSGMNTVGTPQALALEQAPPQQLPQQTLQGLTGYSNLNTAAMNQALSQAGVTGYYTAPATIQPPGTDLQGNKFSDLPPATQQAYYQSRGSDWNAAMQGWVNDSNANIRQWAAANNVPLPGQVGAPQQTMARELQTYNEQMGVINAAAALQASPFRQQQVMGQAGRILQGLPGASFSAPNVVAGVGTAGGNTQGGMGYLQQMIDDIKNPVPNQTNADQFINSTPTPNKIDSTSFLRAAPSTQNIILQSMQEKYGLDPKDSLAQIQNTLPAFQAPTTFGGVRR